MVDGADQDGALAVQPGAQGDDRGLGVLGGLLCALQLLGGLDELGHLRRVSRGQLHQDRALVQHGLRVVGGEQGGGGGELAVLVGLRGDPGDLLAHRLEPGLIAGRLLVDQLEPLAGQGQVLLHLVVALVEHLLLVGELLELCLDLAKRRLGGRAGGCAYRDDQATGQEADLDQPSLIVSGQCSSRVVQPRATRSFSH
jgi:hypothetical protein